MCLHLSYAEMYCFQLLLSVIVKDQKVLEAELQQRLRELLLKTPGGLLQISDGSE